MNNENNSNLEEELAKEKPEKKVEAEAFETAAKEAITNELDNNVDKTANADLNIEMEEDHATDTGEAKGIFAKLKNNKKEKNKVKLEQLEAELAELKDKNLRIFAEFDNFKKRTAKERIELMKTAGKGVVIDLLPVLDDFERATKAAQDAIANKKPIELDGFSLIHSKVKNVLANKGLTEMETNGELFDVDLHDAITEIPAPSEDLKGKVVDTVEKGYFMNEIIIRHAKVVVGK